MNDIVYLLYDILVVAVKYKKQLPYGSCYLNKKLKLFVVAHDELRVHLAHHFNRH